MRVKSANRLVWICNLLLIGALVAFGFHAFILPGSEPMDVRPPQGVPAIIDPVDDVSLDPLGTLANPLKPHLVAPQDETVRLIGTLAGTAYLFLARRRTFVNAYVDEAIDVEELRGWRLRAVSGDSARFSTPLGDQVLPLQEGPSAPFLRNQLPATEEPS